MAKQAVYSSSEWKQPARMPHGVRIKVDSHPWSEIKGWLRDRSHIGVFRFDEGAFHNVFWFSNENTAFEFKVRFG
jgi:hypothetical protein